MSNWVMMLLNNGKFNGEQFLSEDVINDMFTSRTFLYLGSSLRKFCANLHTYGLGWNVYDLHGRKAIYHDGRMPGYIERVMLVPEENLIVSLPTKSFVSEMEHWHFDTFKIHLDDYLPDGYVTVDFNSKGEITGFKIDLPNPDFHFNDLYFEKMK